MHGRALAASTASAPKGCKRRYLVRGRRGRPFVRGDRLCTRIGAIAVEPGEDRACLGGRLAGPRGDASVARAWHLDQRRRNAAQLERRIILLGLTDGGPIIVATNHDQGRSLDVAD